MEDESAPITDDIYHINDIVDRAFCRRHFLMMAGSNQSNFANYIPTDETVRQR